jgi:outer membrane immunogenic protein
MAVVCAGSAWAADLGVAPLYKAAPAIPVAPWTGCYVGANVGGGWSHTANTSLNKPGTVFGDESSQSVIGGGQAGCDYQAGTWVLGAKGRFDFGNLQGSHTLPGFPTFVGNDTIPWLATATARVGYAAQPQLLLYLQGGAAWTKNDLSVNFTVPFTGISETATDNRAGWTVGAGIEYRFAGNWSAFAEYNYMDFGTKTVGFTPAGAAAGPGGLADIVSSRQTLQTAVAGVNYRFGWGAPAAPGH